MITSHMNFLATSRVAFGHLSRAAIAVNFPRNMQLVPNRYILIFPLLWHLDLFLHKLPLIPALQFPHQSYSRLRERACFFGILPCTSCSSTITGNKWLFYFPTYQGTACALQRKSLYAYFAQIGLLYPFSLYGLQIPALLPSLSAIHQLRPVG